MTTIREQLTQVFDADSVNAIDRYGVGTEHDMLDAEVTGEARFCATEGTGALQACCGGDCLMAFRPTGHGRGLFYLVYDDSAGKAWDVRRRQGETGVGGLPGGKPRPHAVLRLVHSA